MIQTQHVVLLYGGKSGEHEISLRSAASVLSHLDVGRYRITPIGMDQDGRCFINDFEEMLKHPDALPVKTAQSKPLESLLCHGQFALNADVVFPVVHGPLYEDGGLQGLLMLANVAFVGSSILGSAVGMDKDIARRLACVDGVVSTRYRCISSDADEAKLAHFCQETAADLGWPLFVKPCSMGSSVGIHKVVNKDELMHAVKDAARYDETVLVEAFVSGREIELAVLEHGDNPRVSIPGEIKINHPDGFYSYTAKYLDDKASELCIPARLDDAMTQQLQRAAGQIFTRLKCFGMARVDFFVDDAKRQIYFNEINTLPGFTSISMYPKLWEASGIAYADLLDELIALAIKKHERRQQKVTNYQ